MFYAEHIGGIEFDLLHLGLGVHFSSEFDCRVFVHARINALMRPHSRSLLPSSVFVWVIIIVSVRDMLTPSNTLTHPVSITSITLRATFTGLSSFQLVPVSTFPSVQGYIFRSISPPGRHIILLRGSHHNFWQKSQASHYSPGVTFLVQPLSTDCYSPRPHSTIPRPPIRSGSSIFHCGSVREHGHAIPWCSWGSRSIY